MIFKSPYPDVTVPEIPLTKFVLERIKTFGDKPAFIDGTTGRTLTYEQLTTAIRRVATGLSQRGFSKGDVFAIYSPNVPEYAVAFLAVALIGGIITTINPLYTADEISHQLVDANAKYLVTISQFLGNAKKALPGTAVKEIFSFDASEGATPFSDLMQAGDNVPEVAIHPTEDIVVLPYSSGTTGLPKGVMLTHYNIVANTLQTEGIPGLKIVDTNDRVIGVLPFFHIYGMVVIMNMSIVRGATVVTMPRFDLVQFLELIPRYQITRINVVPPILVALAKHPAVTGYDTSSLIQLFSGAAPLSRELALEVQQRLKCLVFQGYGMTEASPITHIYNDSVVRSKNLGSIGQPICNTEIRIVDTETRKELGPNESGELWTRGPQIMKGYLNNPQATAATIDPEGWIHTGDIGYVNEEGIFFIVDRLKELIKFKGFQVAPAELEALLLTHLAVADVAVIPVPDPEAGEIPKAFVVRRDGATLSEEEVMNWVAERVSAQKKIRRVEFVDTIPKSASGKILRRVLVDRERKAKQAG